MKNKIFAAILIAVFSSAAFCADTAIDAAKAEYEKVLSASLTFQNQRAESREKESAKLKKLKEEIEKISEELEFEKNRETQISSAGAEFSALNADFERIANTNSKLSKTFHFNEGIADSSLSLACASAKEKIKRIEKILFQPSLNKLQADVEDARGDKIRGLIFNVGAFRYFTNDTRAGFVSDDLKLYGEEFSKMILDFQKGESSILPADLSGGNFMRSSSTNRGIVAEIKAGGVWMYPIIFFGFISLAVCALKIFKIFSVRKLDKQELSKVFSHLQNGDINGAFLASKKLGEPYSKMLSKLIQSRGLETSQLEEISYEYMLEAGEKLFGGLAILSVSAAVAPLFGLLGTVTGIIKTFGDLSFHGAQQAQSISVGISEALITTEYGLIVAIPAFVAHALLSRRAKSILSDMEKMASLFLGKRS